MRHRNVINATVICEPNDHYQIFDVGQTNDRMIKFQKRYSIATITINEIISRRKNNAHMYPLNFQDHL